MVVCIIDDEWDKLFLENFEMYLLLCVVDVVDELCDDFNDGEYVMLFQFCIDLLKLY